MKHDLKLNQPKCCCMMLHAHVMHHNRLQFLQEHWTWSIALTKQGSVFYEAMKATMTFCEASIFELFDQMSRSCRESCRSLVEVLRLACPRPWIFLLVLTSNKTRENQPGCDKEKVQSWIKTWKVCIFLHPRSVGGRNSKFITSSKKSKPSWCLQVQKRKEET